MVMEGYRAPNGNWYRSPQEEIEHERYCLQESQDSVDTYKTISNWLLKPAVGYLALRSLGLMVGIGPDLTPEGAGAEIETIVGCMDGISLASSVFGGLCKITELLCRIDLRSSKKSYAESQQRLGIINGEN